MLVVNLTLLWGIPGGTEWLLILLVVLLFFGGTRIPKLMRGIGKGVKEFNDAKDSMSKSVKDKDSQSDSEDKPPVKETQLENK